MLLLLFVQLFVTVPIGKAAEATIGTVASGRLRPSIGCAIARDDDKSVLDSKSIETFELDRSQFDGFRESWHRTFPPSSRIHRYNARDDPSTAVRAVHDAFSFVVRWLPRELVVALASFPFDPTGPSAILIRGLPIDDVIPPTPTKKMVFSDINMVTAIVPVAESWLLGIGRLLGVPTPPPRATGDRGGFFRDLVPNPGDDRDLPMHRDFPRQAMGDLEPEMLLLLAVRGDPGRKAMTIVTDSGELLAATSSADKELLQTKKIQIQLFHPNGTAFNHGSAFYPIDPDDGTVTLLDLFGMQVTSPDGDLKAVEAYKRMSQMAHDMGVRVDLQAGDMLIINNCRLVHGRTAFGERRKDGTDRWLVKGYVSNRLWKTSQHPGRTEFPNLNPSKWVG